MARATGGSSRSSGKSKRPSSKRRAPSRSATRGRSTRAAGSRRPAGKPTAGVQSRSGRAARSAGRASNDALSLLAQDHRAVEKLFKRVPKDPLVFEQLREELDIHARVEEEIFYPVVEEALRGQGEELIGEARQEHQEVKDLLAELVALDREGDEFEEKLQKLQDSVEHHVEEEEGEIFPKTRRALPPEELVQLGNKMRTRKEEIKAVLAQS
jgi:iron-sulfur cluster repair protein YtfE (RIC family)